MRSNPLLKAADALLGRGTFGLLRLHAAARSLLAPGHRSPSVEDDAVRTVLAIKLCCLGDGLLAVPALRALKARWPQARLVMMATPRSAPAFDSLPFIDELFVLPFTGLAGAGEVLRNGRAALHSIVRVRRAQPDIAVDLDLYYKATPVLAYLTGARVRGGFDTEGCNRAGLYTVAVSRDPHMWETDCFLSIVEALGAPTDDKRLEFNIPPEASERADELLAEKGLGESAFIALCPGSSKNWPAKQWPPERFGQVADWAAEHCGAGVVMVGSGFEGELCDRVASLAGCDPINLAGETSVAETAAILSRASALVTNDTGPLHLACAVGTPVVAVFGPTDERKWGPRGPHDVVVKHDACQCRPCYYLSYMPDCEHRRCLTEIPAERVTEALVGILQCD